MLGNSVFLSNVGEVPKKGRLETSKRGRKKELGKEERKVA